MARFIASKSVRLPTLIEPSVTPRPVSNKGSSPFPDDQRRAEFADRDRDIAGDRRDDDPEGTRMFCHYPACAAPPLCYNHVMAVVGGSLLGGVTFATTAVVHENSQLS